MQNNIVQTLVGKLQWLSYTRPNMSYSVKELARSLRQPSTKDIKKLEFSIKYLAGTIIYRFRIRPISNNKTTIRSSGSLHLNIFADSDRAGCQSAVSSYNFLEQHFQLLCSQLLCPFYSQLLCLQLLYSQLLYLSVLLILSQLNFIC